MSSPLFSRRYLYHSLMVFGHRSHDKSLFAAIAYTKEIPHDLCSEAASSSLAWGVDLLTLCQGIHALDAIEDDWNDQSRALCL